jgi:peptide/nickel transport system substrate-binding protein
VSGPRGQGVFQTFGLSPSLIPRVAATAVAVLVTFLIAGCSTESTPTNPTPGSEPTVPSTPIVSELPTPEETSATPIASPAPSVVAPTLTPATATRVPATPSATPSPTPTPEVVLRTAEIGGWTSPLDPHQNTSAAFHRFFGNVYSGLVRWQTDEDLGSDIRIVVPDLAESWSQLDAQTYEFRLHEGARWHDVAPAWGRKVTADDVVFSIQRLLGSAHQSLWRRVASATAVDALTVRITLTRPYLGFLSQLASGFNVIVLPEAVDGGPNGTFREGPPVGTGPLVFDAASSHYLTRGIAVRNETFYEPENPRVDRLERIIVGDPQVATAMLRTGTIDYLFLGADGAYQALGSDNGNFKSFRSRSGTGWALTLRPTPPFDDERARRAANMSIDRAHIWATYTQTPLPFEVGLGMPLPGREAGLLPDETNPYFSFDRRAAQELLESIGPAGREPFIITIPDLGANEVDAALELVRSLRKTGFSVEANVISAAFYAATVQAPPGIFDVALGPVGAPPEADLWLHERFGQGGAFNLIGPPDADLARLIEEQRSAIDAAERGDALRRTQVFILEAAHQPMVFLDQTWLIVGPSWAGWPRSFMDDPFQRFIREISPSASAGGSS